MDRLTVKHRSSYKIKSADTHVHVVSFINTKH